MGPFVGYKYTSSFGLTFDSQVGYGFFATKAEVGGDLIDRNSSGIPILNLNLGWSFDVR